MNIEEISDDCEIIWLSFPSKLKNGSVLASINRHHKVINIFLIILSSILNKLTSQYCIWLMGDFNPTGETKKFGVFINMSDLECLIKKPICFQCTHPNCFNLFLTNKKEFFKNSNVLWVGISDHHSFFTALNSQLMWK